MSTLIKPPLGRQLNRGHRLSLGIVGCWLLNEGGGNRVNDLSGNGGIGTLGAGTVWAAQSNGVCLDLNAGAGIDLGIFNRYGGNPGMTVALWYKAKVANIAAVEYLLDQTTGSPDGIRLYRSSGEDVMWDCTGTDLSIPAYAVTFTDGIADTNWHFIVGIADAAYNQLCIDGVWATPTARAGNVPVAAGNLWVGVQTGGAAPSNGYLSSLQFWNRALSPSEIAQLYREPFAMFQRERIELWGALGGEEEGSILIHPNMTGNMCDLVGGIRA